MSTRPLSSAAHAFAQAALVVAPFLIAGGAHATSASGAFTVSMPVNSPTCTVATSNPVLALPTAVSQSQTVANYLSTNAFSVVGQNGGNWVTSAALNQTATITCTTASVPILSFVVEHASGATFSAGTGSAYLVDSATTPNKAANGGIQMLYEQVSVNGTAAAMSYAGSTAATIAPYTTTFSTSAVANGTATVVWRPAFFPLALSSPMATPQGGSYSSPGQIVVNY